MRRAEMIERLTTCLPVLHRSGIKKESTEKLVDSILHLDGPGVSKRNKWFRVLEAACTKEAEIYKDLSPAAWQNLKYVSPGSSDLKAIKAARAEVRNAWRSST